MYRKGRRHGRPYVFVMEELMMYGIEKLFGITFKLVGEW
jgi:hypothetical protein